MRRAKSRSKRSRRRTLLLALAGAVCAAGIGAAVGVITAGGSSGPTHAPTTAARHASAARRHSESTTSAKSASAPVARSHHHAAGGRGQAAAAPTQQSASGGGKPSPASLPPATKGAGAFGPVHGGRTTCRAVVHIGDSTSEGLDSPDYLPKPSERIGARYADVGATTWHPEITGATSIVETLPGGTNAHDVALQLVRKGYRGCWVIALGTNDTADVAVGSAVGLITRIRRMMSAIGNQPVMWVNVKSLVASGPYAEANMQRWNNTLLQACPSYPNMRVFDWASVVRDNWFTTDGIHFTSEGYKARARLIADALAKAFPASGVPPGGCLVH